MGETFSLYAAFHWIKICVVQDVTQTFLVNFSSQEENVNFVKIWQNRRKPKHTQTEHHKTNMSCNLTILPCPQLSLSIVALKKIKSSLKTKGVLYVEFTAQIQNEWSLKVYYMSITKENTSTTQVQ